MLSVIVPVYKDWDGLKSCLSALEAQTVDKSTFEVIVVNNCIDYPPPPNFAASFATLNLQITNELKTGSYAARNKGINLASGNIIAFTDSDCIPANDWLERGISHFEIEQDLFRISGHVNLFYSGKRRTAAEVFESLFAFEQEKNAAKGTSVTANMLARKAVFDEIGLFNESLLSGGDHEWGFRAYKSDFLIRYKNDVVVSHPARQTFKELASKRRRVAGGTHNGNKSTFYYLFRLLVNFKPPIKTFLYIQRHNEYNLPDKMKIVFVFYLLRIVEAVEHLSLSLWAKPRRQ